MTGRLINEYIRTTIQKAIDCGYATLRDTKYLTNADFNRVTIYVGKLRVYAYNKTEYILDLGELKREDGPSEYTKIWKNDVGGLLIRDIRRDNKHLYKEISIGTVTKCLVRQMTKEEVEESVKEEKPYSIVVFYKDTDDPKYFCIIKVIEYKKTYSDEGASWYSEIYNPEEDEALQKRIKKEERIEDSEEDSGDDEERQFADLGLMSYDTPEDY